MVRKSTSAARRSSITCSTSLRSSPSPTMMPDLVNIAGIELLDPLQQPDRGEVARARPHREIFRRHGFEIVVEHVGPRRDHGLDRAVLAQEIGRQHLDRGLRAARADGADDCGEMRRAAVGEIVAVDRGDDHMGKPELCRRLGDVLGLVAHRAAPGRPVLTLQKAQARVQVSPMIMKVACFFSQHSPILGQPASSQTVCRPFARTIACGVAIALRHRRLDADPVGLLERTAYPAGAPSPDGAPRAPLTVSSTTAMQSPQPCFRRAPLLTKRRAGLTRGGLAPSVGERLAADIGELEAS